MNRNIPDAINGFPDAINGFANEVGMRTEPLQRMMREHRAFADDINHQVEKANASVRFTVLLLRWLPWLFMVVEQLLGVNVLSWLTRTIAGGAILAYVGLVSLLAGRIVSRFNAKVSRQPRDPGIWHCALAQALQDGVGATRAGSALRYWGRTGESSAGRGAGPVSASATNPPDEIGQVENQLAKALAEGVPVAAALRLRAEQLRKGVRQEKELALARLPFKLLLPTGLLLLPAFMVLVIGPMILGFIGGNQTSI